VKYAILVGPSGSTFVKEHELFVSQGGLKEDWGKNWKIVEAESDEAARVIAIGEPGARPGLYCAVCGRDRFDACEHVLEPK
jgi:hypothetical protein